MKKELSKAEELLLLSIFRLKENAYGVTIRKEVKERTRKLYTYGTLYGLLDQLYQKGYVDRFDGEPTKERGGRRKTFYKLTAFGVESLKNALQLHNSVWEGISEYSLEKGEEN